MLLRWQVLLFAIVLLSFLDVQPVVGKRGFGGGHSYPKSGGLSGGGSHGYPKSGGLSGGGHGYPSSGGHGYPSSSGGLSGGGHGYPSSGGNHGYPPSGGRNSYPSTGGNHGYPSSGGNHGYPSSGGNHGYPSSGGLSGNSPGHTANKYPSSNTHTTIHNHYHYTPPRTISYMPPSGGPAVNYPVYRGTPPTYVYQIKDSGSKYGTLLTGLALLNLGALAGTAYAVTHSGSGGGSGGAHYTPQPGEILIISVCWVAGAGVGLLPLFGWYRAVDSSRGCYFVEVMDYNYLLFLYFATILTPSVLLAAFYAHIYRVVVNQLSEVMTVGGRGRLTGGGTMLRVLGAAQKREVKATQNLAIIVFFFILCWMPLYTVNAIKAFMPDLDIPNPLTYFCIIFSHLNSAINPLLYAYHLKDFRSALKGLLCSIIGRGVPMPAAYRAPAPIRRPALERCNALRERPRIYVHSPVWLRQREQESLTEENVVVAATTPVAPDVEPFLNIVNSSSDCHTPEARDSEAGPYLIDSGAERCQSPYKKVEELIRRVRSAGGES